MKDTDLSSAECLKIVADLILKLFFILPGKLMRSPVSPKGNLPANSTPTTQK